MKPSLATALGLPLAVGAALLAHRFVLDLELMGWDSYPLIAASAASSLAELLTSLTQELMGGRYPEGSFYRPVTSLLFSLDHALSGLDPAAYQRTNLALHVAGVVAVFALARHWLGARAGCVVAALVFAIHPLQLETVPVAARRADMLFTLFLVLALRVQPLGEVASWWRLCLGALLVLLSAASKDTGAVALPVVAAALWLLPASGDAAARSRRCARRAALPALAFGLFFALRTSVLGGIGGHPGSSVFSGALQGVLSAPDFARSLLMPQPWSVHPPLDALLCALLAAALGVGLAAGWGRGGVGSELEEPRPAPARVAGFAAFWILCLLAITGVSGERAAWYAVPFLPPYALILGLAVDAGAAALRGHRAGGRARAAAAVAGVAALVLLTSHLRFSPLFHSYPEWQELSRQERGFLDRFTTSVSAARPGTSVTVPGLPLGTGAPLERVGVRSALCLSDYSVEAYAELALPDLPLRVLLRTTAQASPPTPGLVTVDAIPLASPVLRPAPQGAR